MRCRTGKNIKDAVSSIRKLKKAAAEKKRCGKKKGISVKKLAALSGPAGGRETDGGAHENQSPAMTGQ